MIDEIEDRSRDVQMSMISRPVGHEKYQYGLETKEMAEIGCLAVELFRKLQQQAQIKAPSKMGAVVVKQSVVNVPEGKASDQKQIEQEIEDCREQIHLLSQTIAQDKQRLKSQEQIQLLQQYNRNNFQSTVPAIDPNLKQKIKAAEEGIQLAQDKMVKLQRTLKEMKA